MLFRSANAVSLQRPREFYVFQRSLEAYRIGLQADTTVVLSDSRLFWGQCIASTLRGVVRYSTEYLDGRPVRTLVRETVVQADSLVDTDPVDNPTLIEMTLERVYSGRCQEVPPHHRPRDP